MTDKADIRAGRLTEEKIAANFADMHPALTPSEAIIDADRCYFCYDAPCTKACPTGIDIPGFIQKIRSGNLKGSAHTILSENIMGGMCARAVPTAASVDSLPTSANQEDHVSMATFAARRLGPMAENTRGVIAIELLAAAQGIDFRRPLGSSPALEKAHSLLRAKVAFYDHDRQFAPDIAAAKSVISSDEFLALVPNGLTPSR